MEPIRQVHRARFDELSGGTLYRLLQLRSEVFVVEQECVYLDLDGLDTAPDTVHLWLADGPQPLSYLRILHVDGVARLGRVCTAPAARGSGLAGVLLTAALAGIDPDLPCELHAQAKVVPFYQRHGFAVCGPEFDEDGIPHVPMRRERVPEGVTAGS